MTTARKRAAVDALAVRYPKASERRRCRVVCLRRSSWRYVPKPKDDVAIQNDLDKLAKANPRYGYRRMTVLLREQGWRVNAKRVYRLWRQAGLKVPKRQVRRRRLGDAAPEGVRYRAAHKNHVWSYDFVSDQTDDGRAVRYLTLVDEYTRESLAIHVGRSIRSVDLIQVLRGVFTSRGAPQFIRSDNGPEFIAKNLKSFLATTNVATLYISPGSPWENPYIESFNARFRDEVLNAEIFVSLIEAKIMTEKWRYQYNNKRPHSSLGYLTPTQYSENEPQNPIA